MAMDISALLARSANKYFWIIIIALSCCSGEEPLIFYDANKTEVVTHRGITSLNGSPFTGILFSLDSDGDTISTIGYKEGKLHGTSRILHSNGGVKSVRYFVDGWKEGEHTGWYENGKPEFLYHYKNDMFEGNQKEWMESGQLYSDLNFENGQQSGRQRVWYVGGKIKTNYIIRNNRRYGLLGTKNCVNTVDSVFTKR